MKNILLKISVLFLVLFLAISVSLEKNEVRADFNDYYDVNISTNMPAGWSGALHNFTIITTILDNFQIKLTFQYSTTLNTTWRVQYVDIVEWGSYTYERWYTTNDYTEIIFYADSHFALEDDTFIYFVDTIGYVDDYYEFDGYDTVLIHKYENEIHGTAIGTLYTNTNDLSQQYYNDGYAQAVDDLYTDNNNDGYDDDMFSEGQDSVNDLLTDNVSDFDDDGYDDNSYAQGKDDYFTDSNLDTFDDNSYIEGKGFYEDLFINVTNLEDDNTDGYDDESFSAGYADGETAGYADGIAEVIPVPDEEVYDLGYAVGYNKGVLDNLLGQSVRVTFTSMATEMQGILDVGFGDLWTIGLMASIPISLVMFKWVLKLLGKG